jgi:histidinol dehydrogenase
MLRIITQQDVKAELQRISSRTRDEQVLHKEATVSEVLQAVKRQGDKAVLYYTAEFDHQILKSEELRISPSEMDAAYQQVPAELIQAVQLACRQIESFHRQRVPKNWVHFGDDEIVLGKRYTPIERVGLYVPRSRASYISTILMNAIPAKVAGVPSIAMVTPPRAGKINPGLLVAAQEAGIKEIYRVGGAQAIASLAYGTETVPKVNLIAGSGNIYVTLAKKLVYGDVGIDTLANTSEVLIIADNTANAVHIAADMLAQAEHEPMGAAILMTTNTTLAKNVQAAIERQLVNHPRRLDTEKAIAHNGLIIIVESLEAAAEFSNEFAPEHLELAVADPWAVLPLIRHAGAIFLGHSTPKAIGDYLAGANHILPASGAARYASSLGVENFLKYSNLIQYSQTALENIASTIDILANAEGLTSHADSIRQRVQINRDEEL